MAYISRDPFAREEIHRTLVYTDPGCDFCGTIRRTKKGRPYLYHYTIESDGGRRDSIKGVFCSIGCMRAYHGN